MEENIENLNMEELEELFHLNNQMIARLEEEKKMYIKKIKYCGPGAELAQRLKIIQRADGTTNLDEIKETLYNEILNLERRLSETCKLTGISIIDLEESIKSSDETPSKSLRLKLQVLGNEITLICNVDELLSSESGKTGRGRVSWVEVWIPEEISNVLGDEMTKFTEEAAIHPIMSLIKSYLLCVSERDKLINHFTQAYPEFVTHFRNEQIHGLKISKDIRQPTFLIEWPFKLQETYVYVMNVTLSVEFSKKLKSKDSNGVLDSAPEIFSHMTSLLGLKKAIDRLVRMVVSEGEDIMSPDELQSLQTSTVGS